MDSFTSAIGHGLSLCSVEMTGTSQERRLASHFSISFPIQQQFSCKLHRNNRLELQRTTKGVKSLQCRSDFAKVDDVRYDNDSGNEIKRKRLGVFVSGGGSNFQAIHDATVKGLIRADITVLVTDKPSCGGAEYARNSSIPVLLFPRSKSSPDGLSPTELVATLRKLEVDFLLLAGYLKLIPAELVRAYPRSILNIHPSLLPAFGGKGFYGLRVHQAVIASGARYSGPTIHFVDEHYDTGLILAQRIVPVLADDTPEKLAARVLHEEHKIYVEAVRALCEDRIIWREDGVPIIRSKENLNEYS